MHYFCIKISKIFWGGSIALSPDPTSYPSAPYSILLETAKQIRKLKKEKITELKVEIKLKRKTESNKIVSSPDIREHSGRFYDVMVY